MTLFSRVSSEDRRDDVGALLRELRDVAEGLDRAEQKLAAIEALEGGDAAASGGAMQHVRLLCRPGGYAFSENDGPPPAVGDLLEVDREVFLVERLGPSPLPGDPRRAAVLVLAEPAPE